MSGSPRACVRAPAGAGLAAEEERQRTLKPVYRRIDSVAGEVEPPCATTTTQPGARDESAPLGEPERVVILGSEPKSIGPVVENSTTAASTRSRPIASSATRR